MMSCKCPTQQDYVGHVLLESFFLFIYLFIIYLFIQFLFKTG